ncbi:MAG: hypothetical protein C0623_09730 [Desulfuromonas sp.]|nr:MAG: hypothetical protein C0623_09730 [Desulfuromonas sp.]
MASKDKLLASAQKALANGKTTRAIKDYQKIVELDKKDYRSRQKLADLCAKAGLKEAALEAYEVVAKNYADSGFYLKAIAVYKQMQKVDSSQLNIYAQLAELNEKQGLTGNALAEYRTLATQYEKNEMPGEAINILQKMKELDPENLNVRVKIAELHASLDESEKGKEEFLEVLEFLKKSNNFDKILKLYEVFLPLFPNEPEMGSGLAEAYLRTGKVEKSLKILRGSIKKNPNDKNLLQMLAEGYRLQKDFNNERLTLQHLLKLSSKNLGHRLKYIRCCMNLGEYDRALHELEEWKEAFFEAEKVEALKECYERLHQKLPNEEKVARTLKLIYEETGEADKLSGVMSSLTEEAGTELDMFQTSDDEVIDDSIMDGITEDLQEIELAESDLLDDQEEVPLDILEGAEEIEELEELEEIEELEELEEIEELEELEEVEEAEEVSIDVSAEADMELEIELDLDDAEDESVLEISEDDLQDETFFDLESALEEVEFYVQQGLLDEAEKVCQEILAVVPDNAEANEKLSNIREQRSAPVEDDSGDFIDIASEVMTETDEALAEEVNEFDLSSDFSQKAEEVEVEAISVEDAESHYNLGIAYKEMGLVDDAIAEFDKAMKNPTRLVDSLALKAMCLAETGAFEEAEQYFWSVLEQPGLGEAEKLGIQFELGLFYENFGKIAEAITVIEEVSAIDPGYRDAGEKLEDLKSGKSASAEGSSGKNSKDRVSYI